MPAPIEALRILHPDCSKVTAENGTLEELGESVLHSLREEYFRTGLDFTDGTKQAYIVDTLGIAMPDALALNGEDGLGLHDNFLGTSFLRMYVTDNPENLQNWLNTSKASLAHKAPIDLVLDGQFPSLVGYVFDAFTTTQIA